MSNQQNEQLVITPMPALCLLLLNLEQQQGRALTESEVVEAADNAVCVALPASEQKAIEEARGYRDLNFDDVWNDWLGFKKWFHENKP